MKVIERRVDNYSYPVHVESVSVKKGETKKGVNFELYQVHGHLIDTTRRNVAILVKKEYVQKNGYLIINGELKKATGNKWGLLKSVAEETIKAKPRLVNEKFKKKTSVIKKSSYGLSKMYVKRTPRKKSNTKKRNSPLRKEHTHKISEPMWLKHYDMLEERKKQFNTKDPHDHSKKEVLEWAEYFGAKSKVFTSN